MTNYPDWYNELKLDGRTKNYYFFTVVGDHEAELANLGVMLSHCGISLIAKKAENGNTSVSVKIDTNAYFDVVHRGAGRKKNLIKDQNWDMQDVKVGDVKRMRDSGMTHKQIIDKIGCPRATYYRALKDSKEIGRADDMPFFL